MLCLRISQHEICYHWTFCHFQNFACRRHPVPWRVMCLDIILWTVPRMIRCRNSIGILRACDAAATSLSPYIVYFGDLEWEMLEWPELPDSIVKPWEDWVLDETVAQKSLMHGLFHAAVDIFDQWLMVLSSKSSTSCGSRIAIKGCGMPDTGVWTSGRLDTTDPDQNIFKNKSKNTSRLYATCV